MALKAAEAALDKKAIDLEVLDLDGLVHYTDYFIICSGNSTQQVHAIADNIEGELRKLGHKPTGVEGRQANLWVLLDYGDIVVHVFERDTRDFYALGKLWLDAPRLSVPMVERDAALQQQGE